MLIGVTTEFKFMIFIKSINSSVSLSHTCRRHTLSGTEQCKNIYDKNVSTVHDNYIRLAETQCMFKNSIQNKKAFQSKANRSLSQVNKFEQGDTTPSH